MSRAYSFLNAGGLTKMPNPYGLPVFLVRLKGTSEWEEQPATSIEQAARKFARYADVKSGVVEALPAGADPDATQPATYRIRRYLRTIIK